MLVRSMAQQEKAQPHDALDPLQQTQLQHNCTSPVMQGIRKGVQIWQRRDSKRGGGT